MLAPAGLRAVRLERGDGELVVFSYPLQEEGQPTERHAFTAAESEVVRMLLQGRKTAEIAAARGVKPSTVAKQIERIYRRLGIRSRAELAARLSWGG